MVSLCDETRFQILPSDEDWDLFKDAVARRDMRLIVIDRTFWHNALTRCKGVVTNIPIMADGDNSNRTKAVTSIKRCEIDENSNLKEDTYVEWVFNKDYSHTNITNEIDSFPVVDSENKYFYKIYYESVCCPITQHHFYTYDEKQIKLIFTGQLQGQNSGSPFRRVESVANNYVDKVLRTVTGGFIKRTAPIVQLLTKHSMDQIHSLVQQGMLKARLGELNLPKDDSELMVKFIDRHEYTTIEACELEELEEQCKLSLYYPIITYKQTTELIDTLPDIEVDLTCIGLGSAGTGILDQVVRSNWFEKFMLVDFDSVEDKNLRNQWYQREQCRYYKTEASESKIYSIKQRGTVEVIKKRMKFQDANLQSYVSKYLISGFDSIECRLELLDYVTTGKTKAKYIIDTRYDDLDASIFFIDTSNEAEMEYYRKGLKSDLAAFKEIEDKERKIKTEEDFMAWIEAKGIFDAGCGSFLNNFGIKDCAALRLGGASYGSCHSDRCIAGFKALFNSDKQEDVLKYCNEHPAEAREESSCIKQNLIDIYKFASSFVFSAIREIEDGNAKPFTHIEATTNRLPASMVLRK